MGYQRLATQFTQSMYNVDLLDALERQNIYQHGRGVLSGLAITAGAGLVLNIAAGVLLGLKPVALIATTTTLPASSTVYVWINEAGTVLTTATNADPGGTYVCLGRVTTGASTISTVDATGRVAILRYTSLRVLRYGETLALFDMDANTITFGGSVAMGGSKITGLGTPTGDADAATKAYVDAAAAGVRDVKESCRVATTANITLSGEQTIDGIAVVAGNRVLVKNQTTGADNGIYACAAGGWSRATDADASAEVTAGLFTWVSEGTANGNTGWLLTTDDPITLGTTALVFAQIGAGGAVPTGTGFTHITGGAQDAAAKLVEDVDVHAAAAIAESKLSLASDAAAGTPSRRTLGTGATQAAAGNHTHAAAAISYAGGTDLAATDVEGAIDELALEKIGFARSAKTGAYTVVAADRGYIFDCTSGTFTISLTSAATLGSGFVCAIYNTGTGVITIDPAASETIRVEAGTATNKALAQGEGVIIVCDGLNWFVLAATAVGLAAHLADAVDAHDASAISYAGGVGLSATDVEGAIDELATEKADLTKVHLRDKREMQVLKNPGAATATIVGLAAAPTLTATLNNDDAADGPWMGHDTTNSNGNPSGVISAFTICRRDWLSEFIATVKPSGDISTVRLWAGMFSASPDASATPAIHLAAFRYDTVADTTAFWRCCTDDGGAAPTVTVTTVAVVINTSYLFRIEMTASSVLFYINDVLVATHTTDLPGATTLLGYGVRVTTLAAAIRTFRWGRIGIRHI